MNPYLQRYRQNSVTTASPKSLIVQLHDKAIMELEGAQQDWGQGNLDSMRQRITLVQDIVSYLHSSLDPENGVTPTLSELYRYYLIRLSNLFIEPNEGLFSEIKGHFVEWRDTWWKAV